MVDIVLIHPTATHGIYGELGNKLTSIEQPLWCRLIAGYLRDRGWDVAIADMEAHGADHLEHLLSRGPRIAAICVFGHQPSASTQQMVGARAVAEYIKDKHPSITRVMLGNHPSALPKQTMREEPVDFVVDGEGPVTLDGLLKGNSLSLIPGLAWKRYKPLMVHQQDVICNPPAPLLNLADLHGDAWDLLPPPTTYRSHAWQCLDDQSARQPYAAIYTSLGCPYECTFCMINTFQHTNRYRMRDPAAVVNEITALFEQGVRTFKIIDELFVLNRRHYYAICEALAASGLGSQINIWTYSRTDTVKRDDLPILRAGGVRWLALGIESGAADVRDASRKKIKGEGNGAIKKICKEIRAADINIIGNYIFGLETDTHETMQQTLDLALELKCDFANFYSAMPYPGSALYEGISKTRPQDLPPTWAAYSQHNRYCHPLRNDHLSAAEILEFRDRAFRTYYLDPGYRTLVFNKFGIDALAHIDEMLEYELPRDLLGGNSVERLCGAVDS